MHFEYGIDSADWDKVVIAFRNYSERVHNNILVSVADNEICIHEFYDSGIRHRGSEMTINNEITTTLSNNRNGVTVEIITWRTFESRIVTNAIIILAILFNVILIMVLFLTVFYNLSIQLEFLGLTAGTILLYFILIVMWQVSSIKYKETKRRIQNIVFS